MFSAPTLAKFAGILYLTLELGVLHIALTHMRHFHLGRILKKKRIFSERAYERSCYCM